MIHYNTVSSCFFNINIFLRIDLYKIITLREFIKGQGSASMGDGGTYYL